MAQNISQQLGKKIGPHAIVLGVFLVLVSFFFRQETFQGKHLKQGDIINHRAAAREMRHYEKNKEEIIFWTGVMFAGMPTYTIGRVPLTDFTNALYKAFHWKFLPGNPSKVFGMLLSFYILLVAWGLSPAYAAAGAIAFAFCGNGIISIIAGHNSKVLALAFAPLVLAGVVTAYRGRYWLGYLLSAAGMSTHLHAYHYQITYYLAIMVAIWGLNELIVAYRRKRLQPFLKASGVLLAGALTGVALNATALFTTLEYSPHSMRGEQVLKSENQEKDPSSGLDRDYAFQWSNAKMETFNYFIPRFFGGSSNEPVPEDTKVAENFRGAEEFPYYWGDQPFTEGPQYLGVTVVFLFLLGMVLLKGRHKWWLLAAALFGMVITWGKNLPSVNYLLFDYFPAFSKFRSVTMAFAFLQWAVPLGAILGLYKFTRIRLDKPTLKKAGFVGGGFLALLLLFALMPSFAGDFEGQGDQRFLQQQTSRIKDPNRKQQVREQLMSILKHDRKQLLSADAWRGVIFVLLLAGLLAAYYYGKLGPRPLGILVGLLILADLWGVNNRYLSNEDYVDKRMEELLQPAAVDQALQQARKTPNARVLDLRRNPFSNSRTSAFHHSIGGYSPAKIRRFQDLFERYLQNELQRLYGDLQNRQFDPQKSFRNTPAMNMLNVRYAIFGNSENQYAENPHALGHAWFVQQVEKVSTPDKEIALLDSLNLENTAVVDKTEFPDLAERYPGQGQAKQTSYHPEKLEYQVEADGKGLLVLSEVYYPVGWTAKLDGEEIPLHRVNYLLRAVEVPKGQHKLTLSFESPSYQAGLWVARSGAVLLLLVAAGAVFVYYRRSKQAEEVVDDDDEALIEEL